MRAFLLEKSIQNAFDRIAVEQVKSTGLIKNYHKSHLSYTTNEDELGPVFFSKINLSFLFKW